MPKNIMKKVKLEKLSAGRLMTQLVPQVNINDSVLDVKKELIKNVKKLKSINYIYILNQEEELKGVISIKELFRQADNRKMSSVMIKDLSFCYADANKEEIAYLALKHNLKSIPVLDYDKKFIGAVLSDDILKIVYDDLQEDISRFIGVKELRSQTDEKGQASPSLFSALKNRLPWLIVGIIGGILAAQIINLFEATLAKNILLAAFIPLIVYIANAVGTQAGFFIVRDLALNKKLDFWSYFFKQFKIIISMGVIITFLIFIFCLITYSDINIAIVLSLSVFFTILSSLITGIIIPYVFSLLKLDPASGSGPIATIIQDIASVAIYLWIASSFL
jgi:magnesium transporter